MDFKISQPITLRLLRYKNMKYLVPPNVLVGPRDTIPGLVTSKLPAKVEDFNQAEAFSARETLYAHELKITSLNEVEKLFKQYLRTVTLAEQTQQAYVQATILERKLVALPHNSWKQVGAESFISLNEDRNGKIETTGVLKIMDYSMHSMVGIVFKLQYRVQFTCD